MNELCQGGSSLSEGTIEIMFDRRIATHDFLGVGEGIDEKVDGNRVPVRNKYLLAFPKDRVKTFDLLTRQQFIRYNPL